MNMETAELSNVNLSRLPIKRKGMKIEPGLRVEPAAREFQAIGDRLGGGEDGFGFAGRSEMDGVPGPKVAPNASNASRIVCWSNEPPITSPVGKSIQ
jgi:hypothetical protein